VRGSGRQGWVQHSPVAAGISANYASQILTLSKPQPELPASFEIMQSFRWPRKITRPQSAGPLTPSLNRVSIPSGQTFRAWNLSGPTDHSIGPTCHRAHRDQVNFHCRHSTLFGVPPSKKLSSDPIVTSFPEYPDRYAKQRSHQ
jgi:hypothetical protein